MKSYKYVPFSDGSKCIITQSTLKFSSCSEFNDPFDCIVEFDIKKAEQYLLNRKDLLARGGAFVGLSPAQKIQRKQECVNRLVLKLKSEAILNDVASRWGICSLTTTPNNILMWSHYADDHKGFVVEYSTNQNNQNAIEQPERYLLAWPVIYTSEVPIRDISKRDFDAVKDQFLHKAIDWRYESEYRCLASNAGVGIHKIDKSMITGVIAGAKMKAENVTELKQIILESGLDKQVVFKQAQMKRGKYELELV